MQLFHFNFNDFLFSFLSNLIMIKVYLIFCEDKLAAHINDHIFCAQLTRPHFLRSRKEKCFNKILRKLVV